MDPVPRRPHGTAAPGRLAAWVPLLILPLAGYLGLCLLMYIGQHRLQYFPDPSAADPARLGLDGLRAELLTTPDGERLQAWWGPPHRAGQPVFLYLHGNGANLAVRTREFAALRAQGAGLLALSWRGYGGSSGRPDEAGLLTDARSAYAWLRQRGLAPEQIVLYGESLGSAVAVMLAAEQPVAGLVLDAGFSSALDVARAAYPWLPVRWLMRDTYRADLWAPRVTAPVLQVHCLDDPVTPLPLAEQLHARLGGPRRLERLPARCHLVGPERFLPALQAFLAELPR
jgi:pimeloyl-ACP methyl ester carboxylesterase